MLPARQYPSSKQYGKVCFYQKTTERDSANVHKSGALDFWSRVPELPKLAGFSRIQGSSALLNGPVRRECSFGRDLPTIHPQFWQHGASQYTQLQKRVPGVRLNCETIIGQYIFKVPFPLALHLTSLRVRPKRMLSKCALRTAGYDVKREA